VGKPVPGQQGELMKRSARSLLWGPAARGAIPSFHRSTRTGSKVLMRRVLEVRVDYPVDETEVLRIKPNSSRALTIPVSSLATALLCVDFSDNSERRFMEFE
jgi:hypothetical protein